jgi:hypothetical protein
MSGDTQSRHCWWHMLAVSLAHIADAGSGYVGHRFAERLADGGGGLPVGFSIRRARGGLRLARCGRCAAVSGVGGHHESRREWDTLGKVAVHGGAGDPQHLRDVAGRDALLPELTGFGGIGVVD